jgi:DNA-binding transcriptional regulator/RsmH inhibitor MraZ
VSEERKTICGVPDGDLIDLAWDKLAPEKAEEVRLHSMECAECAAELEALKETHESVGSVDDIAPTVGFHQRLMDRVRATTPGGIHEAGPASRRYAQIVEREKSARSWVRPRWKLLVLATATAATLSAVMLSRMWVLNYGTRSTGDELVQNDEQNRRAVFARYAERKDCSRRARAKITDGRLALDNDGILGDILGEDEIVLAGVKDLDQHESFVVAFSAADWASFARRFESAPEGPARRRFEAIADSKRVVAVRDGQITIPEDLLASHFKGTSVIILKLRDRAEIWSTKTLKTYIGLPPFQIKLDPRGALNGVSHHGDTEDTEDVNFNTKAKPAVT